jgi:hypothetical protein
MREFEYQDIRESFELAMTATGIVPEIVQEILMTVDDAVGNNMDDDEVRFCIACCHPMNGIRPSDGCKIENCPCVYSHYFLLMGGLING